MNLESKDFKRAYFRGTIDGYIKNLQNIIMQQIDSLDLDNIEEDIEKVKTSLRHLQSSAEKCLDEIPNIRLHFVYQKRSESVEQTTEKIVLQKE